MHFSLSRQGKEKVLSNHAPAHSKHNSCCNSLRAAQALFGDSIAGDGNAKLSFLDYLKAVKARAQHLAAVAAQELAEKYSGAPGAKKK